MLIDRFSDYLRLERNRSPLTLKAYRTDLCSFLSFLGENADKEEDGNPKQEALLEASLRDIREWLAQESIAGCSPRSLRRKAQSLRSFYNWALSSDLITANPASSLELAKIPRPLPNFVTPEEMKQIGASRLATDPVLEMRNHLILELLYVCGLRQAELRGIKDKDVDLLRQELKVHGKGGKDRIVPLAPDTISRIEEWRRIRDGVIGITGAAGVTPIGSKNEQSLITGRNLKSISASQLQNIVREALAGSKAMRRSPHTLRHSFATAMLNGGADIMTVKEFLGHSSLSSTQIYTHLNFKELQGVYALAHPRSEKKSKEEER